MKYDTVIFDLDGTLLNTLEDLCDSLNDVLFREGYLPRTLDEVRRFVGNGVRRLVEQSLPDRTCDDEINRICSLFVQHYEKNMQNKTRPYDGIMELLSYLKKSGCKTAIVSNKFDAAVKELAEKYFPDMIDLAVGETQDIRRKPAPDIIYKIVAELNSDIKRTVLVGDSETDVLTAKNACITCIGVSWGFRTRNILESNGADFIIDKPEQLIKIIQ